VSSIPPIPIALIEHWETKAVLKKAALAHRYLAELKGVARTIPNEAILINTLTLQEAKDSSEVENIITSQDDLYKAHLVAEGSLSSATKEVQDYAAALTQSFLSVRSTKMIRLADILQAQEHLEKNRAGLRKLPGTGLKNLKTGEVVYTPPQDPAEIEDLMADLIAFINDDTLSDADPLVKMAIIHHQFESIHPFYDGNGRTGRILNILYLVSQNLLELPVLYLSRFIIHNKSDYYTLLQAVRDTGHWETWLLFMLEGVLQTAKKTIVLIENIHALMQRYKNHIRDHLPKIYSHELLNNLFSHPYTKIEFLVEDLGVTRITATKYLEMLVDAQLLGKEKIGRSNFYINQPLFALLADNPYQTDR
jgi:Fic family protein